MNDTTGTYSKQTNQKQSKENRSGLPSTVAQLYYKHGLFISSYPTCASSFAVVIILLFCYPLLTIPLPGTIPTKVVLPYSPGPVDTVYGESANTDSSEVYDSSPWLLDKFFNNEKINNLTFETIFPWIRHDPSLYVQQILLRTSVIPWSEKLQMNDAFRGPLHEVFKLLEIISNHEDPKSRKNLGHLCLHVDNVKRQGRNTLFPEYNCLLLSPANLWQQNVQSFNKDTSLLNTIFHQHKFQKTKVSVAEMLFGMQMRDTGIKRYPIRVRPRVIQYAVTLVLRQNDHSFIHSLKKKLAELYPLHQQNSSVNSNSTEKHVESVLLIYYPSNFNLAEVLPLVAAFIMLFIYVYFSIRKIEIIKSRLVLAIFAVITVFSSLMMSLGICFFFGLTISLHSKGVFPYLVILVGLENVLVITKSVESTDNTLDVKVRIAQGLSREGWSISKTLLTEITILTIGLSTFVPVIQEFCIFAIVGLISDFVLQMLLFSTVLALNLKRIDFSVNHHVPVKYQYNESVINSAKSSALRRAYRNATVQPATLGRSRSHPKLSVLDNHILSSDIVAPGTPVVEKKKIPKRLRIVNFWVRTRFFQRGFMIWMCVWMLSIFYNSKMFGYLLTFHQKTNETELNSEQLNKLTIPRNEINFAQFSDDNKGKMGFSSHLDGPNASHFNDTEQINKLKHRMFDMNVHLSKFHWSSILKQYNISIHGRYVAVLPTIKISHAISPDTVLAIRNPDEINPQHFQWKALAAALDPIDFNDADTPNELGNIDGISTPFYPKSPMEIMLAALLCLISICVLTYTMIVLYRCICSRNYAEWRSSWSNSEPLITDNDKVQRFVLSAPIQLKGHTHRIECLVTDGKVAASSCLAGQIKLWDTTNGENIASIDRSKYFNLNRRASMEMNQMKTSSIWCLDYLDDLVIVGCGDGKIEIWEMSTGKLKCVYENSYSRNHGVTHVTLYKDRIIAARINGKIDFLQLETYSQGQQIDWNFTSLYRRTHSRTASAGSVSNIINMNRTPTNVNNSGEEMRCILLNQPPGHQQPITCMEVYKNLIFTGSQDHTLKVYKLDVSSLSFTLHGHCGPITSIFIDQYQNGTGGSGSQDGLLCVWDLVTGACMYSIQAHDGAIRSLSYASSYIISMGADDRLCVWERFQGNLLNTMCISQSYSSMLMLTPSLLVTGKPGSLLVWDVRTGEVTREVKLDRCNSHSCPKIMLLAYDSVICDYDNELRLVRFPMAVNKTE